MVPPKCTMFQLRYMCELKRGYLHENLQMPFIMVVFQFKEEPNPTQPNPLKWLTTNNTFF